METSIETVYKSEGETVQAAIEKSTEAVVEGCCDVWHGDLHNHCTLLKILHVYFS